LAVLIGGGVYAYVTLVYTGAGASVCSPLGGKAELKDTLSHQNITAITEWQLSGFDRYPNAVVAAPDGSVWFGEQSVPGIAHFFPENDSLVEYAWPSSVPTIQGSCPFKASIWGIALWKGMVWATDGNGNVIVGLNPENRSFVVLTLPQPDSSPYTLTTGPDGALWFTALTQTPFIGRVSPSRTVSMYPILNDTDEIPTDIEFVNSSYAYFTALNPLEPTPSGLYSFNPEAVAGGITPTEVGENANLTDATSVAVSSSGTVWVVQHRTSNLWGYDPNTGVWTVYPTSTENYTSTTLPYFVGTSGGTIWFNEHYANRIAELNPAAGTLTEYSESNPPATNYTQIQNDLTIAVVPDGLWFTSMTGNYIGFVNVAYDPSFSVLVKGSESLTLSGGENATVELEVHGSWDKGLRVSFSDSEAYTSTPTLIGIGSNMTSLQPETGTDQLTVRLSPARILQPGRYTVAVTVSDGLVSITAYIFLTIE